MFKRVRFLALVLLIVLLIGSIFSATTLKATPETPVQSGAVQNGKTAVIIIDRDSGKTLLAKNADAILAPASTTKLMTALLIASKSNLSDTVVVGQEVVGVEGSFLGLAPGDRITVRNLLYALLLPSSNEAATALAARQSGSVDNFVSDMNAKARALGLKNTKFVNPNGLPADGHVTTAREMATIAKTALDNQTIRTIIATTEKDITFKHGDATTSVHLVNTNKFLGVYPGVHGMKTGTTTEAGQCLVTYAEWNCGKVIMVVLNSNNRYADTKTNLDNVYEQLQANKANKNTVKYLPMSF